MRKINIKIIISSILLISLICIFTSCNACSESNHDNTGRMVDVEKIDSGVMASIYYDKYTKVMYIISHGPENNGNATVMVDANGNPLLYDGE